MKLVALSTLCLAASLAPAQNADFFGKTGGSSFFNEPQTVYFDSQGNVIDEKGKTIATSGNVHWLNGTEGSNSTGNRDGSAGSSVSALTPLTPESPKATPQTSPAQSPPSVNEGDATQDVCKPTNTSDIGIDDTMGPYKSEREAAEALNTKLGEKKDEYFSYIFENGNGGFVVSTPMTDCDPTEVNPRSITVNQDYKLVGDYHNHPRSTKPNPAESTPSEADISALKAHAAPFDSFVGSVNGSVLIQMRWDGKSVQMLKKEEGGIFVVFDPKTEPGLWVDANSGIKVTIEGETCETFPVYQDATPLDKKRAECGNGKSYESDTDGEWKQHDDADKGLKRQKTAGSANKKDVGDMEPAAIVKEYFRLMQELFRKHADLDKASNVPDTKGMDDKYLGMLQALCTPESKDAVELHVVSAAMVSRTFLETKYSIGDCEVDGDTATVEVTMISPNETDSDSLPLKRLGGKWKIDLAKAFEE